MKTKEQKQDEAYERAQARAARSPGEQLAILRGRGITSGKEYERLMAVVESGRASVPNGEAPADKLVPEDASTYPKPKTRGKKKGGKRDK